ncbi:MAG: hypothetical protein HY879_01240 [Deltaproteobacteria bacterium]|nr:hypothetical protein [Deltaproteobacteria bacterium]
MKPFSASLKTVSCNNHPPLPLPEFFDRDIEAPLSFRKIIALIGVRRSGKTSFLFTVITAIPISFWLLTNDL